MTIGIIATKHSSMGTGVVKTQIVGQTQNNVIIPAWAKSLVAVRADYMEGTTLTTVQGISMQCFVESDDIAVSPYEFFVPPINGPLAPTMADYSMPEWENWPINCPVRGGENLRLYGQMQVLCTAAPYAGMTVVVSDRPLGKQLYAKHGTLTATPAAAGEVAGTPYTIYGSTAIKMVYGAVHTVTPVTDIGIIGHFRLTSSDFRADVPIKYPWTPLSGSSQTALTITPKCLKMARFKVDVPTFPACTIQDYGNFGVTQGAASYWQTGLLFER